MESLADQAQPLILAGGLGTRLRQAVPDRPKVLAPVAGRPFLSYLLEGLAAEGFRESVLCTGYMSEQLKSTFGDHACGLRLSYSAEPSPLGTAGAVRHALSAVTKPYCLILNGDSFCAVSFAGFCKWALKRKAPAALVLAGVADTSRFGRVVTDAEDHVVEFLEKGAAGPGLINAGIYLIHRSLLEQIPSGRAVSLEKEVFPGLAQSRQFHAYQAKSAEFIDIGTPESYAGAESFFGRRVR